MGWFALGLCLFTLLFLLGRAFVSIPASSLSRAARAFIAAFSALAGTGFLMFGRFGLALIAIAAAGMAVRALLADRSPPGAMGGGERDEGTLDVETAYLAMRLDKATGSVEGTVRAGAFAGRRLSSLELASLKGLLGEVGREDPPSVSILEAYLDRRDPHWRSAEDGERGAGEGAGSSEPALDERTALEVLGLGEGATVREIKAAHRRLMARLHPDGGGSTWIASRINQARDVLLRARG